MVGNVIEPLLVNSQSGQLVPLTNGCIYAVDLNRASANEASCAIWMYTSTASIAEEGTRQPGGAAAAWHSHHCPFICCMAAPSGQSVEMPCNYQCQFSLLLHAVKQTTHD